MMTVTETRPPNLLAKAGHREPRTMTVPMQVAQTIEAADAGQLAQEEPEHRTSLPPSRESGGAVPIWPDA